LGRYYIGLAATIHDPALAIVNPSGVPVFAEGTERYLQCKRAYNCPPDDMIRAPQLIEEYCETDAELVAAITWSSMQLTRLNFLCGASPQHSQTARDLDEESWPFPDPESLFVALRNSVSQASINLTSSKQIRNSVLVKHYDHHLTHAANAAYTSPFEECVVAVIDAYGEAGSTGFFRYKAGRLEPLSAQTLGSGSHSQPAASLGFYYARLCALCGFDPIKGEEWKVMGLAPYGVNDRRIYELLRPMFEVTDLELRAGCSSADLIGRWRMLRSMARPLGCSPLKSADLAHTGQKVFEEVMSELLHNLWARGISENLALSGGCALNSSFNGQILQRVAFRYLHVPSAPADDGNALGAALLAYGEDHPERRRNPTPLTPYLGSLMSRETLESMIKFENFFKLTRDPGDLCKRAAALLAQGKILGWIQGRAEFGPRALGNRSILADPRPIDMKDRINAKIKFREEFRPFAPSILDQYGPEYFEDYQSSPYMERTLRFRPEVREKIPAVVHVDGTGRLQSVTRESNERFYDLIVAFHELTGVPLLLNTSFNIMGKPIIHGIEDAIGMFMTTALDALVVEDFLIEK
jgi:carbamoyltransferase